MNFFRDIVQVAAVAAGLAAARAAELTFPAAGWTDEPSPLAASNAAPGGVLVYETFAQGNETVGRPARPEFLLAPGELLHVCKELRVVGYEDGFIEEPARFVQRITAVRELPQAGGPSRHLLPIGAS